MKKSFKINKLKKFFVIIILIIYLAFSCPKPVSALYFDIMGAAIQLVYTAEMGLLTFVNNIFCDSSNNFNWLKEYSISNQNTLKFTAENIIKGKFALFDANIFEKIDPNNSQYYDNFEWLVGDPSDPSEIGAKNTLRRTIAGWYYSLLNFSIVALLCVLVYVGIRMITSTMSQDKAKYKTMIKDWAVAICLLVAMHYIMIATLNITSMITKSIGVSGGAPDSLGKYIVTIQNIIASDPKNGGAETDKPNWNNYRYTDAQGNRYYASDAIAYCVYILLLAGITFVFAWKYLKREFTVIFLILLGPISCITYPIDKISDGKAQAFNKWLTEFVYNVLIQPFHLLLYIVLAGTGGDLVEKNILYGIACLAMIFPAEKFVKEMFGFKDKLGSPLGAMAAGAGAAQLLSKGANAIKNSGGNKGGSGDSGNVPSKLPKDKVSDAELSEASSSSPALASGDDKGEKTVGEEEKPALASESSPSGDNMEEETNTPEFIDKQKMEDGKYLDDEMKNGNISDSDLEKSDRDSLNYYRKESYEGGKWLDDELKKGSIKDEDLTDMDRDALNYYRNEASEGGEWLDSELKSGNIKSEDLTEKDKGALDYYNDNKEDDALKEYHEAGYDQNSAGEYFNPNTDEYDKDYDPHTDFGKKKEGEEGQKEAEKGKDKSKKAKKGEDKPKRSLKSKAKAIGSAISNSPLGKLEHVRSARSAAKWGSTSRGKRWVNRGKAAAKLALRAAGGITGAAVGASVGLLSGKGIAAGVAAGVGLANAGMNAASKVANVAGEYASALKSPEKQEKAELNKFKGNVKQQEKAKMNFMENKGRLPSSKELDSEMEDRFALSRAGLSDSQIDDAVLRYQTLKGQEGMTQRQALGQTVIESQYGDRYKGKFEKESDMKGALSALTQRLTDNGYKGDAELKAREMLTGAAKMKKETIQLPSKRITAPPAAAKTNNSQVEVDVVEGKTEITQAKGGKNTGNVNVKTNFVQNKENDRQLESANKDNSSETEYKFDADTTQAQVQINRAAEQRKNKIKRNEEIKKISGKDNAKENKEMKESMDKDLDVRSAKKGVDKKSKEATKKVVEEANKETKTLDSARNNKGPAKKI